MFVINTRPEPDNEIFAALIRGAGAVSVASPVMAIRFRDEPMTVEPDEALAFTSSNGVRAFARASEGRDHQVYAVGEATADAARRAGFSAVTMAGGDVESLTELILISKETRPVLHFAGSDRAGDLVAALASKGVAARRLVIYDAVPVLDLSAAARKILASEPEKTAVALFSPRSAALFFAQIGRAGLEDSLGAARLLALSDAVAAAALKARWGRVDIASERSVEALAALIRI
ncbi:MAG: uroporphyrinogen-III synthase [Parvularculaceae bacterium]|nr:uroporphyrinogen-III synthase [Parvularculaceae bacterium]